MKKWVVGISACSRSAFAFATPIILDVDNEIARGLADLAKFADGLAAVSPEFDVDFAPRHLL